MEPGAIRIDIRSISASIAASSLPAVEFLTATRRLEYSVKLVKRLRSRKFWRFALPSMRKASQNTGKPSGPMLRVGVWEVNSRVSIPQIAWLQRNGPFMPRRRITLRETFEIWEQYSLERVKDFQNLMKLVRTSQLSKSQQPSSEFYHAKLL
jgi:hypothetical protein